MAWIYLIAGILISAVANALIKKSNGFEDMLIGSIALVLFGIGIFLYGLSVKTLPLNVAYIAWTGVSILLITFISIFYFNEIITPLSGLFIAMTVIGVFGLYFVTKT